VFALLARHYMFLRHVHALAYQAALIVAHCACQCKQCGEWSRQRDAAMNTDVLQYEQCRHLRYGKQTVGDSSHCAGMTNS
jgi:hypothetical protein